MKLFRLNVLIVLGVAFAGAAMAQGTAADYQRAEELRTRYIGLVPNTADEPNFSEDNKTLVYRRTLAGGGVEFIKVDLATLAKTPALDQEKLAKGLSDAAKRPYDGKRLPFGRYTTSADGTEITFETQAQRWRCKLADYTCAKVEDVKRPPVYEGMGPRNPLGTGRPDKSDREPVKSPNGALEAYERDFNVWVREAGARDGRQLSFDGSKQNFYVVTKESWSPDSKMLAVSRTRPGEERYVNYVESSPDEQLQPVTTELFYNKPGDVLTDRQPVLFDITSGKAIVVDRALFPNAYSQSEPKWWADGRGFYIRYNQRGHQVYRIVEVNRLGVARAIINEESKTYVEYNSKTVFEPLNDGREIVWMSERDGWCHLYLYDGIKGVVKKQVTKGPWAVRSVLNIDQERRTITFSANGMRKGEDPYFTHYYRINFDGTGLVPLTEGVGTHQLAFSPDRQFYVDIWSRVDLAPVAELRRASDGAKLMELEHGDMAPLLAAGWSAPEPFVAKGRDGVTDIYGLIVKPTNFDPGKKYPVIESIYAGPQGAFTPKNFASYRALNGQAELGFIVVQIDGMGTNYRSKAFHDVAWKNLKDAGFPDRILWHKAVAAKYPWYDISRVGIFGGSAGGQNAMGALLFHPEFYDAAFAYAGSHDNRMDKIWWNEQYMGWPVGPEYSASSNVDNADRLQGKLMLVVGELDTNVDPSSTYQVANALIKAGKTFDFLLLPGAGHTEGGTYGERRRWDFFVKELLGVTPIDRNAPKTDGALPAPQRAPVPAIPPSSQTAPRAG